MSLPAPETASNPVGRDVIVVGASMGGFQALGRLLSRLPADLPASLSVILHTADREAGLLARVLGNSRSMPVVTAAEGERFAPGVSTSHRQIAI